MRKLIGLFFIVFVLILNTSIAENNWATAPVITEAYESDDNEVYLEWQGEARLYRIYLDDKEAETIYGNTCVLPVKGDSQHRIKICPLYETENVKSLIDVNLKNTPLGSLGINISSSSVDISTGKTLLGELGFKIDLSALGLDSKSLEQGEASKTLSFKMMGKDLASQVINDLSAYTDAENRVCLVFTDYKNAEEYTVFIKKDKNRAEVSFSTLDESNVWISRDGTTVSIILDPSYLIQNNCIVPALDNTYVFSIQLKKRVSSFVDGKKIEGVYYTSKETSGCKYVPKAIWKNAPEITYASQTADGQVELEWEHEGLNCQYDVYQIEKTLVVKTGEKLVGTTGDHSFVLNDLLNGTYIFIVVPKYGKEQGNESNEISVEVNNDWVIAPKIQCVSTGSNEISLTWEAGEKIESYHVTVYKGNSKSPLKYANMDFKKVGEYDFSRDKDELKYTYSYTDENARVKFEVYGIRHAANGSEQQTAVSSQIVDTSK